jgi:hypothetical protein
MQELALFENKLRICVSDDFYMVQEPEAVEMFPYQERPQFIFAAAGFSRYLTFSLLEKKLGSGETIKIVKELRKLIWSLYPSSLLSEANPLPFGNLKCCGFSFRTGAGESQAFNTMFAVSFEGRLLLGTYGCEIGDEAGKTLLRRIIGEAEYSKTGIKSDRWRTNERRRIR